MVEGTVVGREGSQAAVPLVGVAVVVKGSLRNHAVTDLQGRYSIRVPSSTDTLQFTYLGYKPLERVVGSRTRLDVEMLSESQQVDAVVVTALGLTRKEKSLGYAVSTVGSEDLNNTVTNNWLNGMAGKVAGLNFDTSSAGPGGSIRVTLRGEGSLAYQKNEARFVVDGVPINSGMTSNTENGSYGSTVSTIDYGNGASDLNPDDIESVSVLKGPAATALYGSRAANGAIIITTKSGLKSGGLRVTFNSNVTLEQAGFWPDFQEEYGSGVYESAQIDGVTTPPEYSYWNVAADKSDTGQKITRYHARSSFGERYDPSKMRYIYSSRNWDTDEYTRKPWVAQDWYKGFFRTGVTYSNSISIEGGNGKGNSARVSFKDMRNDWIVPNTGYESQNLSFSFSTRISKAVTVSGKANYYRKNSDNLPSAGYSTASPLYALIWNPSSVSVDDMYAEWSEGRIAAMNAAGTTGSGNLINPSSDNPYFMVYEQLNTQDRDRVYGNVSVNVNIWREKLTLMLRGGMDLNNDFRTQRKPQYSIGHTKGWYREQTVRNFEMNTDFMFNYKDSFGDFHLSAALGGNRMYQKFQNVTQTAENLQEPDVFLLVNVDGRLLSSNTRREKGVNSLYGYVNLSWRDMLFLDLTARNDWSSTLAPGNNSYFYPSVGVSFLLDEALGFRERAPWIDMLKLRGSWANVGNDTDPYQLTAIYSNSDFQGGYRLSSAIQNYNIKPENIESWETGIEARLFGGRIGLHGCGIETHQCGRGQQPRCGGGARSASRRDEELALGHRSQLVEELERAGGVGAGRGDVAAQFEADGRLDGLHLRLSGRCAGTPLRDRLRDGARRKFLRRRGREVRGLLRSQDHRCRNGKSRADGDAQRSGQHLSQLQGGSEHAAQLQGTVAGDDFHGATGRTGLFGDERRALDAGQTRKFPAGSLRRSDRRRGQSPCRRNLFEEPYGDPECRRVLQPLCAVPQQHRAARLLDFVPETQRTAAGLQFSRTDLPPAACGAVHSAGLLRHEPLLLDEMAAVRSGSGVVGRRVALEGCRDRRLSDDADLRIQS